MENALIFKQILPTNSLKKCMEISLENLDLDKRHFQSQVVSYRPYPDVFLCHLATLLGGFTEGCTTTIKTAG